VPGNVNLLVPGVEGEALMIALKDDIAISSGSACTSASVEPSHVLKALGMKEADIFSSIRVGIGRMTTEDEITYAVKRMSQEIVRLRQLRS
jgi:cysteine desulfurase